MRGVKRYIGSHPGGRGQVSHWSDEPMRDLEGPQKKLVISKWQVGRGGEGPTGH